MKTPRRAQLAWIAQAALIVLPVAMLSGVALYFLHEDRNAIEQEARTRAAAIAPDAARRLSEQLRASFNAYVRDNRKAGRLTQAEIVNRQSFAVPDYPRMPTPSDWVAKLSPREAQLWNAAQNATYEHSNAALSNQALSTLSQPGLQNPVRANAQLALLIASEGRSGDSVSLIHRAVALAQQFPGETTEAGTPVADLALLLALRHAVNGDMPSELSGAIENQFSLHPSFLSTDLLAMTTGSTATRLREAWSRQETAREKVRSAVRTPQVAGRLLSWGGARVFRVDWGPGDWLAFCAPQEGGWRITIIEAARLFGNLHLDLPDYMGASVLFDPYHWDLKQPRPSPSQALAFAKDSLMTDAKYDFQLILYRLNPELLYAPYRRRLMITQGLILTAALAALFGLWRLWQTYREQTRLNEMKSNLVSSVSHELRAPIAAVRLMAESLESGRIEGAEKQKDYCRMIVRECRRLTSLVDNILDFSRIDQGRREYHPEPVEALALLRHTVKVMERCADERGVKLRLIDPPPGFEMLQPSWDREAVEQSMVNLLDNAIKHSPAGAEVLVEAELLPVAVRLWVVDSGPGIPASEHERIFALFYRYGSELRRETEGTGIGLSIVKHVAEAHGGRVIVESKPGHGSRFGVELPR